MKRICAVALVLVLLAGRAAPALAQGYPSKTVSVIVPYPPGGSVDGVARILVQKLNETMGQHFIVENRAGRAPETVGASAVATAPREWHAFVVWFAVEAI